ncbi:MAG: YceI family protein [Bacteroidetes bacterium]|nr:YceI family protein [Bacteroidota bacterium]
MKKIILFAVVVPLVNFGLHAQGKYITKTGKAVIYSHTVAEDISADNNNVTGIIDQSTGDIAISVPVQSFQFEKALMQEHFNSSNFMDSKQFPRISFRGKITNSSSIDFSRNGKYEAIVQGELTIKGTTQPLTEKASMEINNGRLSVSTKFTVKDISSFGVGKPMGKKKNNVADDIDVSYTAVYEKGEE